MERPYSILVIGGGKMGEAILSGWISSDRAPADAITASGVTVVNPGQERRAYLRDTYGVATAASLSDPAVAGRRFDIVVLSVKPQVMMSVLEEVRGTECLAGTGNAQRPLFISIAAGLTTVRLSAALPAQLALVRVMPNTPLQIGQGASGVCGGPGATDEQVQLVCDLFGCLGRAVVVDESDMDAVCAVSGSGPAYVAAMIEAMRDAAAAEGLDAALAETLALQTVLGAASLIAQTGVSPQAAREAVCSPNGTTLAALDAMNAAGFAEVFKAGISAAVARSKELAQC